MAESPYVLRCPKHGEIRLNEIKYEIDEIKPSPIPEFQPGTVGSVHTMGTIFTGSRNTIRRCPYCDEPVKFVLFDQE